MKRLLLALLLCGCADAPPSAPVAKPTAVATPGSSFRSDWGYEWSAWKASGAEAFSPFSLSQTLSLLGSASTGTTRSQICSVLRTPEQQLASRASEARRRLEQIGRVNELAMAQRLFTSQAQPAFVEVARKQFATEVLPPQSTAEMDAWVSNATRGAIAQVSLDPPEPGQVLAVSCLYLKADWQEPFDTGDTRPLPFLDAGKVATMTGRRFLSYGSGPGYHFAEIPYAGHALVFDCILPDRPDGLVAVEGQLTAKGLQAALAHGDGELLDFSLPRFSVRTGTKLRPVLESLGLTSLFDPAHVQLAAVAGPNASVDGVDQQILVEVDEKGTRAAAVTMATPGAVGTPKPSIPFHADHPFLFLIRDSATNQLYFIGRVTAQELQSR